MKKLFVGLCLAVGVVACGPVSPEEEASLESSEQALCPATCPAGTSFHQYVWLCTNRTSSACPYGIEEEFASCYNSSTGGYVRGGSTCRTRCGCLPD
ncbi:hypothetical protein HUA74_09080 [Myxococcus sp. CA051A]|uniref:hypothetical protein n=1 Tax=Myxococcus sp. CA051A TaxID=2741739 RepID=UPI00157A7992|nr:hypothetical protein [Myxococcus sp. CA051A]NTX60811.1 hypothetical protein [Myxococcus sp. CA051A]